ncbi:RIP metalloprotease RseP [Lutimaribacter sp. EGI FJ00015]|uniref:RIP metalloprotease RseP n=1 Tax=Lutimaribacter degradans TaxID=2945989 RepID=A0ACC5ZXH3_9RHOB|nr:RIP metalloprotease RseP [Lutimaribacter sp. EGI FJ00013]MCM2562461.1 RIP metalloprotease RseP [Lutimaribacter sp. EGI FJ00013]MCO0613618.1 RIP metalloprotease RseP [Lutimaribacter sp. EGI FJ00015]MCO0636590.1 RIP metalloprotease RseP [Lutimaribacter sp. EGI FJ00014]
MDILTLLPQFGNLIWTLAAFVIALSVIVAIHEYGHYIVGRWSGIHADVFSLGFGPVLYARTDKRGTVWQVAALPFGGYVKFRGDANAASAPDDEAVREMSEAEKRSTMAGAPLWARTATVAAGPIFNFVLAIALFTAVGMTRGVAVDPLTVGEMRPLPQETALQEGDVLLEIDGLRMPDFENPTAFDDMLADLPEQPLLDYTVERDGQQLVVSGPWLMPPVVTQLAPQSAAFAAGLAVGDVITAIDGQEIFSFSQLKEKVEAGEGAPLALSVWRGGEIIEMTLEPRRVDEPQADGGFQTNWRIGIVGGMAFTPATTTPGIAEALWGGVTGTYEIMRGSISGLWHMVTGAISSCNMSGPIGIAEVSGQMASQGAMNFVYFIGVLSAAVGLLNLFPIPVLDGGHLVFYAYEAVAGKPPSDGVLRVLMTVGLVLILSLMVFALTNDIFCP